MLWSRDTHEHVTKLSHSGGVFGRRLAVPAVVAVPGLGALRPEPRRQAREEGAVTDGEYVVTALLVVDFDVWKALQQRSESNLHFGAGYWCSEAGVNTVTERKVTVGLAM